MTTREKLKTGSSAQGDVSGGSDTGPSKLDEIFEREVCDCDRSYDGRHWRSCLVNEPKIHAVAKALIDEILAVGDRLILEPDALDERTVTRAVAIGAYQEAIRALAARPEGRS